MPYYKVEIYYCPYCHREIDIYHVKSNNCPKCGRYIANLLDTKDIKTKEFKRGAWVLFFVVLIGISYYFIFENPFWQHFHFNKKVEIHGALGFKKYHAGNVDLITEVTGRVYFGKELNRGAAFPSAPEEDQNGIEDNNHIITLGDTNIESNVKCVFKDSGDFYKVKEGMIITVRGIVKDLNIIDKAKLIKITDYNELCKIERIDKKNHFFQEYSKYSPNIYSDSRDGEEYFTLTIGNQTFMAENFRYKIKSGCWSYNNDEKNNSEFGLFYNWETASKIAPKGWHLPSESEWLELKELIENKYTFFPEYIEYFGHYSSDKLRFVDFGNAEYWTSTLITLEYPVKHSQPQIFVACRGSLFSGILPQDYKDGFNIRFFKDK